MSTTRRRFMLGALVSAIFAPVAKLLSGTKVSADPLPPPAAIPEPEQSFFDTPGCFNTPKPLMVLRSADNFRIGDPVYINERGLACKNGPMFCGDAVAVDGRRVTVELQIATCE